MRINIVNKYHGIKGEYIGRGSPLGNPYKINNYMTREQCIINYEEYIIRELEKENKEILNELIRLFNIALKQELNLVCYCSPKPCHGDIIKKILLLMGE